MNSLIHLFYGIPAVLVDWQPDVFGVPTIWSSGTKPCSANRLNFGGCRTAYCISPILKYIGMFFHRFYKYHACNFNVIILIYVYYHLIKWYIEVNFKPRLLSQDPLGKKLYSSPSVWIVRKNIRCKLATYAQWTLNIQKFENVFSFSEFQLFAHY
jgi:hypothetical protein